MASTSKLAMFSFIAEVVVGFAIVFCFTTMGEKTNDPALLPWEFRFISNYLQSWTKVLGNLHFFAENRPSSISPSPVPLSMLYQWAESALFRSNIDQGGGGTSLCANATLQSVENRAVSEHMSYFQAVPRTFVQDCLNSLCGSKNDNNSNGVQRIATKFGQQSVWNLVHVFDLYLSDFESFHCLTLFI